MLLIAAPSTAGAQSPSPTPPSSPSPGPAVTASASPIASPTPAASPTPTPTPSPTQTPSATPTPRPSATADRSTSSESGAAADTEDGPALTLQVTPTGSTVAKGFFQDVGRFAFAGAATGIAEGARVEVYRRPAGGTDWDRVAQTTVTDARYSAQLPVTWRGRVVFVATTGGAPGSGDEVSSPRREVVVQDARLLLDKPASRVDSLKKPVLTGSVVPARAGVQVKVDVRSGSSRRRLGTVTTDAAGQFRLRFGYGRGHLAAYSVRAAYRAANRDRWEGSANRTVRRVAVLNAVVTDTTAAEVAKTYRKGCPVGRSRLSTVTMNFYGRDRRMHRGVLIIRRDLVTEIKRGFTQAMAARFPIAKMNNPNVYGGHDPTQMEANNTSGFNCRKVVGNPYAQSPHSYGIAIDVDTVQNPYRDSRGTWWPSNGKPYIDRTPLRFGMLGTKSALTRQLRSDDFFWGGLWNPGRDYQHFEYRP